MLNPWFAIRLHRKWFFHHDSHFLRLAKSYGLIQADLQLCHMEWRHDSHYFKDSIGNALATTSSVLGTHFWCKKRYWIERRKWKQVLRHIHPIVELRLPTNRCSDTQQLAIQATQFSHRPNIIRSSSRVRRNPAWRLDGCRSRDRGAENERMSVALHHTERLNVNMNYLVQHPAAQHVKGAFSGFVKVECHLCIDANTEVIVHIQFAMRQPFHRQSSTSMSFNVN